MMGKDCSIQQDDKITTCMASLQDNHLMEQSPENRLNQLFRFDWYTRYVMSFGGGESISVPFKLHLW